MAVTVRTKEDELRWLKKLAAEAASLITMLLLVMVVASCEKNHNTVVGVEVRVKCENGCFATRFDEKHEGKHCNGPGHCGHCGE